MAASSTAVRAADSPGLKNAPTLTGLALEAASLSAHLGGSITHEWPDCKQNNVQSCQYSVVSSR